MAIPSGYTPLAKIGLAYKGTYVSGTNYKQLDAVYYLGSTYLALIDNPAGSPNNDGVNWRYLAQGAGEDISDSAVTFTQATTRANINSGEQNKTIMGKIKKWFADLTAAAFSQMISSYTDLMANTVSGYLPDALAVKEGFNEINSNLNVFLNKFFVDDVAADVGSDIQTIFDKVYFASKDKFGTNYYIVDCLVHAGVIYHVTGYNVGGYGVFHCYVYGSPAASTWEATLFMNAWANIRYLD